MGDHPPQMQVQEKYLMFDSDQSLQQLFKLNQQLSLSGLVDFDVEGRGKSIFQHTAFKDLNYWGFVHASRPIDALRRFELHWRLSHGQSDTSDDSRVQAALLSCVFGQR